MRRPWNLVDVPVYSLVTYGDETFNMNICTYVSAISLKPKQYMVALYKDTHTLTLFRHSRFGTLQLLHRKHAKLLNMLGKRHGNQFNKAEYLKAKSMVTLWQGLTVLKDCCALVELTVTDQLSTSGDHELFVCNVERSKVNRESGILTTDYLIKNNFIL